MGPQDLVIGFEKGTSFDFEALVFTGYDSAPVVNEDYENAMQEAADITAKVENRPLLYTEETWKIFEAAYESASAEALSSDSDPPEGIRCPLDGDGPCAGVLLHYAPYIPHEVLLLLPVHKMSETDDSAHHPVSLQSSASGYPFLPAHAGSCRNLPGSCRHIRIPCVPLL